MDILVAEFGHFDQSAQGDGAHYVSGEGNPFLKEGLACGNCVAFEGNRCCRWVAGDIDGLGICRLWVIPEDAIREPLEQPEEEDDSEEENDSGEMDLEEMDLEEDPLEYEDEQYGMMKAGTFSPPQGVRSEAKRALKWISEGHAGSGFTDVGRKRASDLARGASVSYETIKRMRSFLSRHAVDSQGKGWSPGSDGYPSPGRVAYSAWGGKAGLAWANKIVRSQENE